MKSREQLRELARELLRSGDKEARIKAYKELSQEEIKTLENLAIEEFCVIAKDLHKQIHSELEGIREDARVFNAERNASLFQAKGEA